MSLSVKHPRRKRSIRNHAWSWVERMQRRTFDEITPLAAYEAGWRAAMLEVWYRKKPQKTGV